MPRKLSNEDSLASIIEKIKSKNKNVPSLPSCLGPCDECDYRRDIWVELIQNEGYDCNEDELYYI